MFTLDSFYSHEVLVFYTHSIATRFFRSSSVMQSQKSKVEFLSPYFLTNFRRSCMQELIVRSQGGYHGCRRRSEDQDACRWGIPPFCLISPTPYTHEDQVNKPRSASWRPRHCFSHPPFPFFFEFTWSYELRMQAVVEPCPLPTNPKKMRLSDFTKSCTMPSMGELVCGIRLRNPEVW